MIRILFAYMRIFLLFLKKTKIMDLYLDIDGVLLNTRVQKPANNLDFFVKFITEEYNCYWLTTHCKGNSLTAINYLKQYISTESLERLKFVKPTNWSTLKTEGINFDNEFIWLEDAPFQAEVKILEKHNKENNLILVDLNNSNELVDIIEYLSNDYKQDN